MPHPRVVSSTPLGGALLGGVLLQGVLLGGVLLGGALSSGCASGVVDMGAYCGDGVLDESESCDDGNDVSTDGCGRDCSVELGYACSGEPSVCAPVCGDGIRVSSESCDGSDLGGVTCESLELGVGTIVCDEVTCERDTSGCHTDLCGNGVLDAGEACDATDLGGASCESQGFAGGTLACSGGCALDTSGCTPTTCGNGALDAGEQCDGDALGGVTCESLGTGFVGGTLACAISCFFDTTSCELATCGNGSWDAGEECDGSDFNGQDCTSFGFSGGSLACSGSCTIDTSGCGSATCGNGSVEAGEECDDGGTSGGDGCNSSCNWEHTCSADDTLVCGQTISNVSGVSGDSVNDFSCSGTWFAGGADRIYSYVATSTGSATVSVNCHDSDMDYDVYIMQGACNPVLCYTFGQADAICDDVTFGATAGLTYYIVVEFGINNGFSDDFDISLSCS